MNITERHAEWLRLGGLACKNETPTAYTDLRSWEAAHAAQWVDLIAHDLEQKKISREAEQKDPASILSIT